jgi:hypothetical protein
MTTDSGHILTPLTALQGPREEPQAEGLFEAKTTGDRGERKDVGVR